MDVEIDGAALAVRLHELARVAELPPLHEGGDAAGRARAARGAADAAHVLDAVAREVEEDDVVDGLEVHATRGAVGAHEQPWARRDTLKRWEKVGEGERTVAEGGRRWEKVRER